MLMSLHFSAIDIRIALKCNNPVFALKLTFGHKRVQIKINALTDLNISAICVFLDRPFKKRI